MCVLLQPFGSNLTEGNESCVCSYRNVSSIAAGIGCTLLMKKNSENAHHFTIGAADIYDCKLTESSEMIISQYF
jgi:hypothetical protein